MLEEYFSEENIHISLRMMRQWQKKGVSPNDIVRKCLKVYQDCNESDYAHKLLMLMSAAMDFSDPKKAQKALRHIRVPLRQSRSVGESVFKELLESDCYEPMLQEFNQKIKYDSLFTNKPRFSSSQMICRPMDSCRMAAISPNIYAYRSHNGTLELILLQECSESILIDEDCFMNEKPLYFTRHTHFISPLYRLDEVRYILNHILARVGYPALQIKLSVYFFDSDAELINLNEYILDPSTPTLKGRLITRKGYSGYFINSVETPVAITSDSDNEVDMLDVVLCESLTATSLVYNKYLNEMYNNKLTDEIIDRLLDEVAVFI